MEIKILKLFCEFHSFFFFTKVSNCPFPDLKDRYLISFKVPNLFLTPWHQVLDKRFCLLTPVMFKKVAPLGAVMIIHGVFSCCLSSQIASL